MGQPRPLFHLFSSFRAENSSCQQDLNSHYQSRRREGWPLDRHHGPGTATLTLDTFPPVIRPAATNLQPRLCEALVEAEAAAVVQHQLHFNLARRPSVELLSRTAAFKATGSVFCCCYVSSSSSFFLFCAIPHNFYFLELEFVHVIATNLCRLIVRSRNAAMFRTVHWLMLPFKKNKMYHILK